MLPTKIERIRGMNDVLPSDSQFNKIIESKLSTCFESFGYRPIDLPVVEYTDLHLRKSGPEIVSRLYDFTYQNRRLCLRPELTASVVRAYVNHLQSVASPIRLYYAGPVFRYEKPQKGRYRQFTQMGIELLGATHTTADAEVIYIASKGLESVGLSEYKLVVGHIGILTQFLETLGLESRLRSFLLANMEVLKKEGKQYVLHRLHDLYPSLQAAIRDRNRGAEGSNELEPHRQTERLVDLLRDMNPSESRAAISELLSSMNVSLDGSRGSDEIVDRLLSKLKRQAQTPRIHQALDFMSGLGQLVGEPTAVLKEASKLLASSGIDDSPLSELSSILKTLEFYPLSPGKLSLDLGLSRGLQYYTGPIFEIYAKSAGAERQLCGGGRYDDLATVLGSKQNVPATGFSYGLERIRLALESEKINLAVNYKGVDAFVIPVSAEEYGYAISVAEQLRNEGLRIEIDVLNRSVKSNFRHANKREIPFVIVIGSEEKRAEVVLLKNMSSSNQQRLNISDVANQIKRHQT